MLAASSTHPIMAEFAGPCHGITLKVDALRVKTLATQTHATPRHTACCSLLLCRPYCMRQLVGYCPLQYGIWPLACEDLHLGSTCQAACGLCGSANVTCLPSGRWTEVAGSCTGKVHARHDLHTVHWWQRAASVSEGDWVQQLMPTDLEYCNGPGKLGDVTSPT
jgi:hypothetical protein